MSRPTNEDQLLDAVFEIAATARLILEELRGLRVVMAPPHTPLDVDKMGWCPRCGDVGLSGCTCDDCGCAVYVGPPVPLAPGESDPRD